MPSHWGNVAANVFPGSSATGTQFVQAVGCAEGLRAMHPGEDRIVLVTSGEGATSEGEFWEAVNQAKKDARATCDTYFSRIVKYAFPKDKAESDTTPTSLKTKIQETIADLVKNCEKAEGADFDLVATLAALQNVLTVVNK